MIWFYQPRWTDEKINRYISTRELGDALGLDPMNCMCVITPFVSGIDYLGQQALAMFATGPPLRTTFFRYLSTLAVQGSDVDRAGATPVLNELTSYSCAPARYAWATKG